VYSSTHLTSSLDGGGYIHAQASFTPGVRATVTHWAGGLAGWASEPVWTWWRKNSIIAPARNWTLLVQS